jgi:hypothetical protein
MHLLIKMTVVVPTTYKLLRYISTNVTDKKEISIIGYKFNTD